MLDPNFIDPELIAIGSFLSFVLSALFFTLSTIDPDTPARRAAMVLGVVCVLVAVFLSALFVSYPEEPAGYQTFQIALECVRRDGR